MGRGIITSPRYWMSSPSQWLPKMPEEEARWLAPQDASTNTPDRHGKHGSQFPMLPIRRVLLVPFEPAHNAMQKHERPLIVARR